MTTYLPLIRAKQGPPTRFKVRHRRGAWRAFRNGRGPGIAFASHAEALQFALAEVRRG